MRVTPKTDWEVYDYWTEAGRVIVTFHTESEKIDQAAFPHCARVIINIKAPNQNGGPGKEEAEVLWAMEDSLVESLEAFSTSCLLLGRLTHSGVRELVFQVADWETFRPPVGKWMMKHGDYETDVSEHEGWDFFFDSVWPSPQSWMLIMDRRVVDSLVKSGSDPEKTHVLEYVFRGPVAGLEQMRTLLLGCEYVLLEFLPAEERLVMSKAMTLDVEAINTESLLHIRNSEKLGVEYDGWGCASVA